ncbi:MAG: glycosyltransferase family 2 protein [Lachnospiraceae bacterium]|jgi:glycosyltransferase involved in cell wall biosynthesis
MRQDVISVIVPVYNVEKYLRRCVDSILNQTYSNLEILLIDDGSTDASGVICDEYSKSDPRIKVFHKENGGVSSARNYGIERATGTYLGFIDSDDWIDCHMYETLLNNMLQYNADVSDIDSITTTEEIVYRNSKEIISVKKGKEILLDYFLTDRYSVCRKLYAREVIGDIRFPLGKINEDIATNFQFLQNAKCEVKSNQKMYYYYSNPNSITGNTFRLRDFDLIDACENLVDISKYDDDLCELAKVKLGISYYSLLGRYIMYNSEDIENLRPQIALIYSKLKKSYKRILFSHIRFKKKIMITMVVILGPWKMKKLVHIFED